MRYMWSAFLLIAAILAASQLVAVILVTAGLLTIVLALLREQKISRLTDELSDILAIKRKSNSLAMERSLSKVFGSMLWLAIVSELIIFTALLFGLLDITVARNYALLVLVALAPLGLELELFALLRSRQQRGSETVRTAIGYATEDARALLAVIGLSLIGTIWLHIPPALSVIQILFITCLARPILSGRALQALPYKADQAWRVGLTAFIAYGSFIFFFIRHYLNPQYADAANVLTWQATSVGFLAFVACQAVLLILEAKQVPRLRLALLIVLLASIVYVPALQDLFMTASIAASDWVWVLLAGCTFAALFLLRHRSL